MARKSSSKISPIVGIIVFMALVVSVPVTLWSFSNTSTETRSSAATTTCSANGGSCYKYECPSTGGYFTISGSCSISDSACCTNKLAAPTGLESTQWYCKYGDPLVEHDGANFWWKAVPYAEGYTLYHRIYSNVYKYSYKAVWVGNSTQKLIGDIYTNLNGRRIEWYVKAQKGTVTSTSVTKTTPAAFRSCPQ